MKTPVFTGAAVAIITPFTEDNKINYPKLGELIEYQIANGTDAVVICGTSGESPCMPHEEHLEAIRFAVDTVAKRVPVIAGTGSNDTSHAVMMSQAPAATTPHTPSGFPTTLKSWARTRF